MEIFMRYIALSALIIAMAFANYEKVAQIDAERLATDSKYLDTFINCLLEKGPCSEAGFEDFKEILPEIIQESCAKCPDNLKSAFSKTVKLIYEIKPDKGIELNKKYDPESKFGHQFEKFLSEN